jgi:hypothetical protein
MLTVIVAITPLACTRGLPPQRPSTRAPQPRRPAVMTPAEAVAHVRRLSERILGDPSDLRAQLARAGIAAPRGCAGSGPFTVVPVKAPGERPDRDPLPADAFLVLRSLAQPGQHSTSVCSVAAVRHRDGARLVAHALDVGLGGGAMEAPFTEWFSQGGCTWLTVNTLVTSGTSMRVPMRRLLLWEGGALRDPLASNLVRESWTLPEEPERKRPLLTIVERRWGADELGGIRRQEDGQRYFIVTETCSLQETSSEKLEAYLGAPRRTFETPAPPGLPDSEYDFGDALEGALIDLNGDCGHIRPVPDIPSGPINPPLGPGPRTR